MKRIGCLVLCLLLWCASAPAEEYRALPDCLRFSVEVGEKQPLGYKTHIRKSYPHTALPAVDEQIALLVDGLAELPHLQPGRCQDAGLLDVNCRIQRSGESAMSFLVLAAKTEDQQQTGVAFENRVYDMASGQPILLPQLFAEWDAVHPLLAEEVRRQINAYYPQLTANSEALDAFCHPQALEQAAFSLTPAQLELHYSAADVYEGRQTLMHVRIPFRTLRPYLSEYGVRQTDNTGYRLAALTYDDGPARGTTMNVLDALMARGAGATFFVVGNRIPNNQDVLARQQDSGFSIGSHNFVHEYQETDVEQLHHWKDLFAQLLSDVTGTEPALLRAPGGKQIRFQNAKIGLPIFHWTVISGDSDGDHSYQKVTSIINTVRGQTTAGSVVLLHDINYQSPQYTREFLAELEKKNILLVTIEDLFLHYGVNLEGDVLYYGCEDLTPPEY